MKTLALVVILLLIPFASATDKISSFIILDVSKETQNNKATQITAHLQTNDGLPIQKELITIFINDKIFTNKFTDKNGSASIHIQITEKTEIFVKFNGSEIYHESISEVIILESSNNNEINSISEISNRLFLFIAVITLGMAGSVVLYIISRKK